MPNVQTSSYALKNTGKSERHDGSGSPAFAKRWVILDGTGDLS